jgi:hypothetical protein
MLPTLHGGLAAVKNVFELSSLNHFPHFWQLKQPA